jgi:gas vesicle protein
MKFTKQQAIEALKAKVPAKDKELDLERTITEAVDNCLAFVGEESEMELNDFVEKAWKSVKSSIGLAHNENSKVAQKLKDQIAELQRKIDGKEPPKTDDDDKPIKTDDPTLKAMLDKMSALEQKLAAKDAEATIAEKRQQLIAKMGESIKDKDWIENYLKEISITSETDVEAKAKDYVEFYNKTHTKGGKVTPKSTDSDDDDDSSVKSVVAAAAAMRKNMSGRRGPVESTTEKNK